jgi:hypothetical protein
MKSAPAAARCDWCGKRLRLPTLMPQMRGGKATLSGEGRKRLTPAFSHAVPSPPRVGRALKVAGVDLVRRVAVTADGDNLRSAGGLAPPRAWPPASAPRGAPAAAVCGQRRRMDFAPSTRTAVGRNTAAQKRPRSETSTMRLSLIRPRSRAVCRSPFSPCLLRRRDRLRLLGRVLLAL